MEADIDAKIDDDFPPARRDEARAILGQLDTDLTDLGGGDHRRVLRCVLHLARGDIGRLQVFSDEARKDWRDVIVWAELGDVPGTYRNFRRPFSKPGPPGAEA